MSGRLDTCRSCAADIIWALNVKTANPNPLDLAPLEDAEIGVGIVAFNPRNGNAHTLTAADVADRAGRLRDWAAKGVTYHRNHFMTCPNAKAHKGRHRNQEEQT